MFERTAVMVAAHAAFSRSSTKEKSTTAVQRKIRTKMASLATHGVLSRTITIEMKREACV